MKIFKKKEKELYWNPKDIDETNAVYRAVIGQRSNGKTYGTMKKVVEAYFDEGLPSGYIRRYAEEIRPKYISELLSPHYKLIEKLSKGKYNSCAYRNNMFIPCYVDKESGKIETKADKPILYTVALNTWNTTKGEDRGQLAYIVFDEFMTRDIYLKDEFAIFANIISSLVRDREIKCIYMLANTVNKYCPYFEDMGLYHVAEQEQGSIEVYTYNNEKLTVAVEYCAAAEATKEVEKYYAFDNPQLDMITSGGWEEARYKRISKMEFEANKETIVFKFLIDFNKKKVVGEVHRSQDMIILFFHDIGNSNYKWTSRDIIFTDQDCYSPLHQNSFKFGSTPAHQIIRQLLSEDKCYYDNNSTGEIVNNFKKYSIR